MAVRSLDEEKGFRQYRIRKDESERYYIKLDQTFETLIDLVEHYKGQYNMKSDDFRFEQAFELVYGIKVNLDYLIEPYCTMFLLWKISLRKQGASWERL